MKIQFLWDEEKTKKFHKAQLWTYGLGAPAGSIYGYFIPVDTPGRVALMVFPVILSLYGIINLFLLNKGNQGWKFIFSLIFVQSVAVIFMYSSGGFKSIASFAPYAVLLVTVTQLGSQATLLISTFSVISFIGLHLWLMINQPQYASWPDFILYTFLYTEIAFVQFRMSKEFSVQFEARKKLEQVDDLKNQFISLSSHYLRTPTTIIKGYLQSLLSTNLTQDQLKITTAIEQSTGELESLTEKLLLISTIEKGDAQLNKGKQTLDVFLSELVKDLQKAAREKEILLKYEAAHELVEMSFDQKKLKSALSYIIDNAIKYNNPHGSVNVSLEVFGDNAIITISDNGVGIKPSELENLFTPFNKGSMEEVLKLKGPGAGLSLYIAKLIIDAHKGKIKVDSLPEKGTVVTISLPIDKKVS